MIRFGKMLRFLPMQLLIIVMLTAIASSTAGYAQEDKKFDECAKVGKLVLMFGQLDHECDKYELTDAGRTAQMNIEAALMP
jgi:hypothetical protein